MPALEPAGLVKRIVQKHFGRAVLLQPAHHRTPYLNPSRAPFLNPRERGTAGVHDLGAKLRKGRKVPEHHGMVQRTLVRLYLATVQIGLAVVPERPARTHIGVRVLQTEEVIAAYPAVFVPVLPVCRVHEKFRHVPLKVVHHEPRPPARKHRRVRDRAAAAKKVVKHHPRWQVRHYFGGNPRLAAPVWQSVSHAFRFFRNIATCLSVHYYVMHLLQVAPYQRLKT